MGGRGARNKGKGKGRGPWQGPLPRPREWPAELLPEGRILRCIFPIGTSELSGRWEELEKQAKDIGVRMRFSFHDLGVSIKQDEESNR